MLHAYQMWSKLSLIYKPLSLKNFDMSKNTQFLKVNNLRNVLSTARVKLKKYESLTYLKRPILRRCENISPPGTYSSTMYKYVLSLNR